MLTAHELMHRIASRFPHACAIRNPCAATHTCQNLLESSVPVLVTADCAVSRILPRGLWLHTRLARVERGIEIVQVPISHIDMKKETVGIPVVRTCTCSALAASELHGNSKRQREFHIFTRTWHSRDVNVNVHNLLAISILDFDNSGETGPQAKGVNP